ncbi:MAG TPA: SRPBCC domain-containing protein [Galbitalea sp.]|jgi:uncharacterized protein YndB with AHSA1/START domain
MTDVGLPLLHGTEVQHINVDASSSVIWSAFAELDFRDRWFNLPGPHASRTHELDFRIGGSEVATSTFHNVDHEERLEHRSRFIDLVEDRRITYAYEFRLNEVLRFVGLTTIELRPDDSGTRVDYTDQYQFFDVPGDGSAERGERRGGTTFFLRRLKIAVEQGTGQ